MKFRQYGGMLKNFLLFMFCLVVFSTCACLPGRAQDSGHYYYQNQEGKWVSCCDWADGTAPPPTPSFKFDLPPMPDLQAAFMERLNPRRIYYLINHPSAIFPPPDSTLQSRLKDLMIGMDFNTFVSLMCTKPKVLSFCFAVPLMVVVPLGAIAYFSPRRSRVLALAMMAAGPLLLAFSCLCP